MAASPIAHDLKMAILENLAKIPERYLDLIITSLENEAKGIEILIKETNSFIKEQDEEWEKVAEEQTAFAAKLVSEEVLSLRREEQIDTLRQGAIDQAQKASKG